MVKYMDAHKRLGEFGNIPSQAEFEKAERDLKIAFDKMLEIQKALEETPKKDC